MAPSSGRSAGGRVSRVSASGKSSFTRIGRYINVIQHSRAAAEASTLCRWRGHQGVAHAILRVGQRMEQPIRSDDLDGRGEKLLRSARLAGALEGPEQGDATSSSADAR